jgi:hypothetical protein
LSDVFDHLCAELFSVPLHKALESTLTSLLSARSATLWIVLGDQRSLYSPGLTKVCSCLPSIVSYVFEHKSLLFVERPSDHEAFNRTIDFPDHSALYLPLSLLDGTVVAVAQVIGVTASATEFSAAFAAKFVSYAHLLFTPAFIGQLTLQFGSPESSMDTVVRQLKDFFKCRTVDIFRCNDANAVEQFDFAMSKFDSKFETAGVATFALKHRAPGVRCGGRR